MITYKDSPECTFLDLETFNKSLTYADIEETVIDPRHATVESVEILVEKEDESDEDETRYKINLINQENGQRYEFSLQGLKEVCKGMKYPFANLKCLNVENILEDMTYRLSQIASEGIKLVVRYTKPDNNVLFCYPLKESSYSSPLFNEDLKNLLEIPVFKDCQFLTAYSNRTANSLSLVSRDVSFNLDGIDYFVGFNIHNDQACSGGHFRISMGLIWNDDKNVCYLTDSPISAAFLAEVPHGVLLKAVNDFMKSHLDFGGNKNLGALPLEEFEEAMRSLNSLEINSQKVGFLFRSMRGVSKKIKQNIFKDFMIEEDGQITDESKPTSVLRDEGLTLRQIFDRSSEYGLSIWDENNKSTKIYDSINLGIFAGSMLNSRNSIYSNLHFWTL